jgi:acetyl-CoA carboxylase biotin carboxyl carrier protein
MPDSEHLTTSRDDDDLLRVLREEVSSLVKTIPGPVASISLRRGDCSLEVTWSHGSVALAGAGIDVGTAAGPVTAVGGAVAAVGSAVLSAAVPQHVPADPAVRDIPAPLVGTFYASPEPGAQPFVRVGDEIEAGATVGIVEAMKLMNPVSAPCAGTVLEVLSEDGHPVEFGQVLIRIRAEEP